MKVNRLKREVKQEEKRGIKQEEKAEEESEQKTIVKCHPIAKTRFMPADERRELIKTIKERARKQALKEIVKQREGSNDLRRVRVDFEPSELLNTGLFMRRTPEYLQLSVKPLFEGTERLAINVYPCPTETCEMEVLLQCSARLGLVPINNLKRIIVRQSITINTKNGRVWAGSDRYVLADPMTSGSRVRLMVCIATRKFRVYVNEQKQLTADFPSELNSAEKLYFYVELLGSNYIRILK